MRKIVSLLGLAFVTMLSSTAKAEEKSMVLNANNHILLSGEINQRTASDFINKLLTAETNDVKVYISSPGGSVVSGMKIVQVAEDLKAQNKDLKITCYIDFAASMAFVITQTICDERLVGQTSALMQHQATFGVEGREGEVSSRVKMILSILDVMDKAQAKRLEISVSELRKNSRDEWWMIGEKAVKQKAADAIAPVTCAKDLVLLNRKESRTLFGTRVEITWSACPLLEYPLKIEMFREGLSQEDKLRIEKKIYESVDSRKKVFTISP